MDRNVATDTNDNGATEGFALAYNARSKDDVDLIFSRLKEKGATILK